MILRHQGGHFQQKPKSRKDLRPQKSHSTAMEAWPTVLLTNFQARMVGGHRGNDAMALGVRGSIAKQDRRQETKNVPKALVKETASH